MRVSPKSRLYVIFMCYHFMREKSWLWFQRFSLDGPLPMLFTSQAELTEEFIKLQHKLQAYFKVRLIDSLKTPIQYSPASLALFIAATVSLERRWSTWRTILMYTSSTLLSSSTSMLEIFFISPMDWKLARIRHWSAASFLGPAHHQQEPFGTSKLPSKWDVFVY